jgi:hypothetical protein
MRKFTISLSAMFFMMIAAIAHAQSLADLAKQERERRNEITNVRVITSEEAAKFVTETEPTPSEPDASADGESAEKPEGEAETEAEGEEADSDEPVDFLGRPESYWRETMANARKTLKDLEDEKNVLILKQNRLENEFYREDDGFKREGIQREIQKTFYEQDLNRENLAKAKEALDDLVKEARKSGALPGWISGGIYP